MFKFLKASTQKVKKALQKSRDALGGRAAALFGHPIDEAVLEEFEKILYEADLGSGCVNDLVNVVRRTVRKKPNEGSAPILAALRAEALHMFPPPPPIAQGEPHITLIVGVNGSGKTTSLAKLAALRKNEGKKIIIGAADTFRAAAAEQLATWAQRIGVDIIAAKSGSDPAAVAFDTVTAATARSADIAFIDTAGRLQNKGQLMQELEKVRKACNKALEGAPHETLLVLDAASGQNALDQARLFHQCTPLSGIILTKLDGSAKGGIILSIAKELGIPVRWIGVGEKIDDLLPFDATEYVEALFSA